MNQNKYDARQSLAALLYHSSTPQSHAHQQHQPAAGGLPLAQPGRRKVMRQARPSHNHQLQLDQEQRDYLRSKYEITGPVAASSALGSHDDGKDVAPNTAGGTGERFASENEHRAQAEKATQGGLATAKHVPSERASEQQDKASLDEQGNKNSMASNAGARIPRTIIQKQSKQTAKSTKNQHQMLSQHSKDHEYRKSTKQRRPVATHDKGTSQTGQIGGPAIQQLLPKFNSYNAKNQSVLVQSKAVDETVTAGRATNGETQQRYQRPMLQYEGETLPTIGKRKQDSLSSQPASTPTKLPKSVIGLKSPYATAKQQNIIVTTKGPAQEPIPYISNKSSLIETKHNIKMSMLTPHLGQQQFGLHTNQYIKPSGAGTTIEQILRDKEKKLNFTNLMAVIPKEEQPKAGPQANLIKQKFLKTHYQLRPCNPVNVNMNNTMQNFHAQKPPPLDGPNPSKDGYTYGQNGPHQNANGFMVRDPIEHYYKYSKQMQMQYINEKKNDQTIQSKSSPHHRMNKTQTIEQIEQPISSIEKLSRINASMNRTLQEFDRNEVQIRPEQSSRKSCKEGNPQTCQSSLSSSSPVDQRGQRILGQSQENQHENQMMNRVTIMGSCAQTPEAYCQNQMHEHLRDQRISHDHFLKTLEHLPKLKNELLRESNASLSFIKNNMDVKVNQYPFNHQELSNSSALRRSRVVQPIASIMQAMQSMQSVQPRKISSNLSHKDKQMFKDQFDTFRNIYQVENKHLTKSFESQDDQKQMNHTNSKLNQSQPPQIAKNKKHNTSMMNKDMSLNSILDSDENGQQDEGNSRNLNQIGGDNQRQSFDNSKQQIQQDKMANDEKLKQLKQFIYTVDLYSIMDKESRQQMTMNSCPKGSQSRESKKQPQDKVFDKRHKMLNNLKQNRGSDQSQGTLSPYQQALALYEQITQTKLTSNVQISDKSNEQISYQNIDKNFQSHFENLLQKNTSNSNTAKMNKQFIKQMLKSNPQYGKDVERNLLMLIDEMTKHEFNQRQLENENSYSAMKQSSKQGLAGLLDRNLKIHSTRSPPPEASDNTILGHSLDDFRVQCNQTQQATLINQSPSNSLMAPKNFHKALHPTTKHHCNMKNPSLLQHAFNTGGTLQSNTPNMTKSQFPSFGVQGQPAHHQLQNQQQVNPPQQMPSIAYQANKAYIIQVLQEMIGNNMPGLTSNENKGFQNHSNNRMNSHSPSASQTYQFIQTVKNTLGKIQDGSRGNASQMDDLSGLGASIQDFESRGGFGGTNSLNGMGISGIGFQANAKSPPASCCGMTKQQLVLAATQNSFERSNQNASRMQVQGPTTQGTKNSSQNNDTSSTNSTNLGFFQRYALQNYSQQNMQMSQQNFNMNPNQSNSQMPINQHIVQGQSIKQINRYSSNQAYETTQNQQSQYDASLNQHNGMPQNCPPNEVSATQMPLQISSTLFIMDCQTFGILNNQKLLKIGIQSVVPGTSIPNSSNYQMTEAQMVNFVMSRAQTCSVSPSLQLPKLSEEAKRILNTIKAQQHLNMVHEIQKIDTLIIEMDYFDYKNQLLQDLFHLYGNKVLSNLVHKIEKPQGHQSNHMKSEKNFQTIHEYIDKIRKHHDDSIRLGNIQNQQLFSQINDFSSGNDDFRMFESYDIKSHSATPIRQQKDQMDEKVKGKKFEQLIMTRSSERFQNQGMQSNRKGGLEIMDNRQSQDNLLQNALQDSRSATNENRIDSSIFNAIQQHNTKHRDTFKNLEENLHEELQTLFPKQYTKKHALQNQALNGSTSSIRHQMSNSKQRDEPSSQKQSQIQNESDIDKKLKNKINFHVLVRNTKLYQAVQFMEQQQRIQYQRQMLQNDAEDNSKGPMSVFQMSSEMSQNLHDLSSFILTKDCSILKFALYCAQVGIVNSTQQLLRQFFKNIFIVVRPGQRTMPDGQIQYLHELPKVDVDKINKYLIQTNLRKAQLNLTKIQQKGSDQQNRFSETQPGPDKKNGDPQSNAGKSSLANNQYSISAMKNKLNHRYDGKNYDKDVFRNYSLKSFKSSSYLNEQNEDQLNIEYKEHFNSGVSTIKVEGTAATEKTTIKIIHKPFTHLSNSRIQKCFKIYNEFVQLVLKNRQLIAQNPDNHMSQVEFSKIDINKIYKLAYHMGIKLPKRNQNNMVLGKTPLLDTFKNHRSMMLIKEQMIRFVHRVLNEENGISFKFFQCVIQGQNFQNNSTLIEKSNLKSQLLETNSGPANALNESCIDLNSTNLGFPIGQVISPNNFFQSYKYQVGMGNNHILIKALMKQRLWWHHIQRDKNLSQTAVQKLDFDEAQIMWTQWRKAKLYEHLTTFEVFTEEFKELQQMISDGKIQIAQSQNLDKFDKNFEKGNRVEKNDKMMRIYCQSVSPRNTEIKEKEVKKKKVDRIKTISRRQTLENVSDVKDMKNSEIKRQPRQSTSNSPMKEIQEQNQVEVDEEDEYSDDFENDFKKANQPAIQLKKQIKAESGPEIDLKFQLEQCKKQIQKVYNKLEFNQHLNNKKALFINMRNYYSYCCDDEDVYDTLPLTFHIKSGTNDFEYQRFVQYFENENIKCKNNKYRKNIWIIKPGENSNRGTGIKVEQDITKIRSLVHSYCHGNRTMILQKYIDNPLLYQKRKFDIRCFSLVTCQNGQMKAYFYRDGYIRTASREFNLNNLYNKYIHLVNDAVQKYSDDYGKYEAGNKLSYQEFQRYLNQIYPDKNINLECDLIMQVKKIVTDSIRATFHLLDSKKRMNTFELFGYDFMFDDQFKPYLIEVNSNPSLEPSSTLLAKLFSQMLDNSFRIAIDPLFPPNDGFSMKKGSIGIEICPENRFDLIFDERIDGPDLLQKMRNIGEKEQEEIQSINYLEGSEDEAENEGQDGQEAQEVEQHNHQDDLNEDSQLQLLQVASSDIKERIGTESDVEIDLKID